FHPRHRHHRARHVLVAAANADDAVHALPHHSDLDRVGDDLARYQRIFHSFGAHADAVGHRRETEDLRLRAGCGQRRHRAVDQRLDPGIAGIHRAVAVGHADDRLVEIAIGETYGTEHRSVWRAGDSLRDDA